MIEWIVIGLVLALALRAYRVLPHPSDVLADIVFHPRLRWLHRWLYTHSATYRRWCLRRMTRAMVKVAVSIGGFVEPMKRAAREIEKFGEALRKAGLVDA